MEADPGGSSIVQVRLGAAGELRRGAGWRVFGACPGNGRAVRGWATQAVSQRGCLTDPGNAALVVSELFTNALLYGPVGGQVLVAYCLWRDGARIIVCDAGGASVPRLRDLWELEEGGRGLQVVEMIAAAWGSFRTPDAQIVWCDLGKPLDCVVAGDMWACLHLVLAAVDLAPVSDRKRRAPLGEGPRCMVRTEISLLTAGRIRRDVIRPWQGCAFLPNCGCLSATA